VDKIKAALAARHMKCGGTAQQRAERLFLCRGRQLQDLPASAFVKGAAPAAALDEATKERRLRVAKHTANAEAKIVALVENLGPVIEDTQAWVEKKLAQNYDELKQDIEREDFDVGNEDSEEEVSISSCTLLSFCRKDCRNCGIRWFIATHATAMQPSVQSRQFLE
jgi:splicing factor 3A subunit 3